MTKTDTGTIFYMEAWGGIIGKTIGIDGVTL